MKLLALVLGLFFLQGGCVSTVVDSSMNAAEAGDRTLVLNACGAVSQGGTVCRVVEGERMSAGFELIVPTGGAIKGGELSILFRDIERTFAITGPIVTVSFRDIYGDSTWKVADHDGELTLLARMRYTDNNGVEHVIKALGFVRVFILRADYAGPMPIDSGFQAWEGSFSCKVQYSTAGRSAIRCSR